MRGCRFRPAWQERPARMSARQFHERGGKHPSKSLLRVPSLARKFCSLECRYKAKGILTCRSNRVAREQSSEVDQFERVASVCHVGLKMHPEFFPLVEIGPERSVLGEVRADAITSEIK